MATVTIHLAPRDIMRDVYFNDDAKFLVKANLYRYEKAYSFNLSAFDTDTDAAEEAFDLTNNPCRQDEREQTYGRKRSVSVGDVVEVDGKKLLCMSCGWEAI